MERHIRDLHIYACEETFHYTINAQVLTIGDNFSICIVQPGKNPMFVNELIRCFGDYDIDCQLMSEERFLLADYVIP